jgi:beta-aspartyl-peptidase (threonine type)
LKWAIIANASTRDRDGILKAVNEGAEALVRGLSAVDAVELSIRSMEDNPVFDAGTGCDINLFGLILMDASIMDGSSLRAGAVGSVRGVKNPVSLARRVMDRTSNVLLVGEGAEEFAKTLASYDDAIVVGYDSRTVDKRRKYERAIQALIDCGVAKEILGESPSTAKTICRLLIDGKLEAVQNRYGELSDHGTVSASALDVKGNFAAGASTGGWTFAIPGRIGDSPLIGCGAYADNRAGAASTASIRGEENMRLGGLTRRVCDLMGESASAEQATNKVTEYALDRLDLVLKRGSLVAIDRKGQVGFNGEHEADSISVGFREEGREVSILA